MMKGPSWHVENTILTLNVIFYVIVGIVYSEAELTGKLVQRSYIVLIENIGVVSLLACRNINIFI